MRGNLKPQSLFALRSRAGAGSAVVALALLLGGGRAAAHPFLDERLALLDRDLAADPANPQLLLARGALQLDEGHAAEAISDLDRALAVEPRLAVVALLRSRALLALDRREEARREARRFLELDAGSARGWRQLAAVESARRDDDAATAAFARYFELAREPRPEDYLARAEVQLVAADLDGARRGLAEGVERLGPLVSLLARALEVEHARDDAAAALALAERLSAASPEDPRWQVEHAEALERLGRSEESRAALDAARAALAARSPARREAPALRAVAERIDQLSRQLAAP